MRTLGLSDFAMLALPRGCRSTQPLMVPQAPPGAIEPRANGSRKTLRLDRIFFQPRRGSKGGPVRQDPEGVDDARNPTEEGQN